jgi:predicted outer membrane protein
MVSLASSLTERPSFSGLFPGFVRTCLPRAIESPIVAIVGLCFMVSANASAAQNARMTNVAKLTDGEIAYIYLQANQFDVDEAKLGIVRGTASAVKQHGEMVAKDHGSVIAALARLADHFHSALRITCPAGKSLS